MSPKIERQPIRHFFVKRSLQYKIIGQILFVVLFSALVTTATLSYLYINKSHTGEFYYMSNDVKHDLELKNIVEVVLPSLLGAQVFAILVGFGIGLFFSRKIAVPIYKFEKWVASLKAGHLHTILSFRENDEMKELSEECNNMADFYKELFVDINKQVKALAKETAGYPLAAAEVRKLEEVLRKVETE